MFLCLLYKTFIFDLNKYVTISAKDVRNQNLSCIVDRLARKW